MSATNTERSVTDRSSQERAAEGKAARQRAPLNSHRSFEPDDERDPVGLLLGQAQSRGPELVPIWRPDAGFTLHVLPWRGAANGRRPCDTLRRASMSSSAATHTWPIRTLASPERRLVFDVNDFDETLPGPFEWDVKRLATSITVAGRGQRVHWQG